MPVNPLHQHLAVTVCADADDAIAQGFNYSARPAGDFGQADDDSAGPGAGSSDDAGTDSEGGETDASDAAEFEAGAAAAIEKATARSGRKTRAVVE